MSPHESFPSPTVHLRLLHEYGMDSPDALMHTNENLPRYCHLSKLKHKTHDAFWGCIVVLAVGCPTLLHCAFFHESRLPFFTFKASQVRATDHGISPRGLSVIPRLRDDPAMRPYSTQDRGPRRLTRRRKDLEDVGARGDRTEGGPGTPPHGTPETGGLSSAYSEYA